MKKKTIVSVGPSCVHGLHTMAPTIDATVRWSDGSTSTDSIVCKIEPSRVTLHLRYLHDAKTGNCLGSFMSGSSNAQVKLF